MRARLAALGAGGVRARTFHSAALAQLRHFAPGEVGRILSSKALLLRQIANGLPRAYRFRPAGDLATEIEWAKNRRIPPAGYRASLGDREPPLPPDLMLKVYRAYEERKAAAGAIDFEDLLERTVRLYETDASAVADFRARYRRVHRRRVPGRQPAPAVAPRALARRSRRPLRGRRRLPVDLRLHGRLGRAPARAARARAGLPARGELPLDAAGARAREPARAEARRRREAAARVGGGRARAGAAWARRSRRGGRVRRRADPRAARRGAPARGDRCPVSHECALGRLRGGAPRGGDPVPGRLAAGARRRARPAEAASRRGRPGGRDGRAGGA